MVLGISNLVPFRASIILHVVFFFFSSRRRHTRCLSDWSSDVCSSDLTDEQAAAFERLHALAARGVFTTVVLHGVTGSGKTELYLRLADAVRRSGRAVLMQIGRASGRERVEISGVAGSLKKKRK